MHDKNSHQTADELRSDLISQLYQYNDSVSLSRIFDRIKLVQSPVFIKPLIDLYYRYKYLSNGVRGAILNCLSDFDGQTVREFITKETDELPDGGHIREFIPALTKLSIYSKNIENRLVFDVKNFFDKYQVILYYPVVRDITYFLKQNSRIEIIYPILLPRLLENANIGDVTVGIMLDDLIDSNHEQASNDLYINFEPKIKGTSLERAIAQRCNKKEFAKLKELINEKGSLDAKLIINKDNTDYYKYLGSYPQIQFDLGKLQTIYEIVNLRNDISKKIKIPENIFLPDEAIIDQTKKIFNEADLITVSVKLRDYITNIDNSVKINLLEEVKKRILPNALPGAYNLSLNHFVLYLNQQGISVNDQLFGIKKIYYLTTLLGSHTKSVANKNKVLNELNLYDLYERKQYDLLHLELLKKYKNSLNQLNSYIR